MIIYIHIYALEAKIFLLNLKINILNPTLFFGQHQKLSIDFSYQPL